MSSRSRARVTSSPARAASPSAAASKKKRPAPAAAASSSSSDREKSPAKKRATRRNPGSAKKSPAKSPAKRGKSPAKRGKSPAKSPAAKRGKSPAKRARSPAAAPEVEAVRSPAKKVKTSRSRKSAAAPARSRSRSPAGKGAAKKKPAAAASRRKTTTAIPDSPQSESDVEMEDADADAPATPTRPSAASITPVAPYSAEPKQGGLGFMPQRTSYPSLVQAQGVSTLLTALNTVSVPAAVFVSPFPADKHQLARRSFGGSKPNEGNSARKGLQYDEEDADEADDEVDVNPRKTLRPTQAQEAAERSRSDRSGSSSRKEDTPTVSRARSRLSGNNSKVPAIGIEEEEVDTSSSRNSRRSTGASAIKSQFSVSGGLVRLSSSPACWVSVALFLLVIAQFLALNASVPDSVRAKDVLSLTSSVNVVQTKSNELFNQFIRPYVGATISAAIPAFNFSCFTASPQLSFISVPLLYLIASFIVRKAYELSAKDAADLPSAALGPISVAQQCHSRQVFVALNAFVSALSFWVFHYSSTKFTAEALAALQRPQQPPVVAPVYSNEWAQVFLTLISFSWAASDVVNFSTVFSRAHAALWTIVMIVAELAFWFKFPVAIFKFGPPVVEKFALFCISHIPAVLASKAVVLPLFVIQVVENIKGCAGVILAPLGRILLLLVPMAYLCGGFYLYNQLVASTAAYYLQALAFLLVVAVLSSWESIQNGREIQGKKYVQQQ